MALEKTTDLTIEMEDQNEGKKEKTKIEKETHFELEDHMNRVQRNNIDRAEVAEKENITEVIKLRYKEVLAKIGKSSFTLENLFPTKVNDIRYITFFNKGYLDNSALQLIENKNNKNGNIGIFTVNGGRENISYRIMFPMLKMLGTKRGEVNTTNLKKDLAQQLEKIIEQKKTQEGQKTDQIDKGEFFQVKTILSYQVVNKLLEEPKNNKINLKLNWGDNVLKLTDKNPNIGVCVFNKATNKTLEIATIKKEVFLENNILNKDNFKKTIQDILTKYTVSIDKSK